MSHSFLTTIIWILPVVLFIRHDPYLPSVPASLQALGRVGCAVAFTITPRDSRVASPRVITFQLYQCPWIQKIDY
jgi:hypothetical protein